jgi:hypothetical protein
MSDVDPEIPEDDELEDDDESGDEAVEDATAAPVPTGRNFQDLPEGFLTLVGFSKLLAKPAPEGRGVIVKSQVLYSTAKNTKTFPLEHNTDGRWMVNVEKGLEWWDAKETRKAERAAAAVAPAEPVPAEA